MPLSSDDGRKMFARGIADGTHEGYFPLAEQFMTQSSPPYCALTTLAMMLNSLNIDPNERWKGGWRWFNEDMLIDNCCKPKSEVEADGMTMDEFAGIGRCHGAAISCTRASDVNVDTFRQHVIATVSSASPPLMAASFSRATLGQSGDGHFSPIAGYDAESDHVLVLDVARFKYPPWYAPLPLLFDSMLPADPATGRSRGYMLLAPSSHRVTSTEEKRDVPADGGGGINGCPVAPIRREFCPVPASVATDRARVAATAQLARGSLAPTRDVQEERSCACGARHGCGSSMEARLSYVNGWGRSFRHAV